LSNSQPDPKAARSAEPVISGDASSLGLDAAPPILFNCIPHPNHAFPLAICAMHGQQPSAYFVCHHIAEGEPVDFSVSATRGFSGVLLCRACSESSIGNRPDVSIVARLTLKCCHCLHAAGLLESPEVPL